MSAAPGFARHKKKRKGMREFAVEFSVVVTIDQRLLDSVLTDDWRSQMFPFYRPEQIAEHLAFNLVQGTPLKFIDGYADQDPKRVEIGPLDVDNSYELHLPAATPKKKVANGRRRKTR